MRAKTPRSSSRRRPPGAARSTTPLAEIEAGPPAPSPQWKVRYGLMLGLERVLADPEPHTAAGTPLRRHQIDALAGMLTELISAVQRDDDATANGNGHALADDELADEDEDEDDVLAPTPRPAKARTRTTSHSARKRIPAPFGVTASVIRPHRARRSPLPASSRPHARSAS